MSDLQPSERPLGEAGGGAPVDIQVRLRQLRLMADFSLFALREPDLNTVMQRACELVAQGLDTKLAKILRYYPETSDFLIIHGVGWHDGVVGHARLSGDLGSPAGFAVQTREPVISSHLAKETRFRTPAVLEQHNVQRAINVIIGLAGAAPFGVLEADSSCRTAFHLEDCDFLQTIANVLAAAIERDRHQAAQASLLREKDILIQEVHHRTKNSLQIVQTMLNLQARGITDSGERGRLQDAASRIMTISAVHRCLHEEGAVLQVQLASYFQGLIADLVKSLCPSDGTRTIEVDVAAMQLAPEQAMPLGLIASELLTNAIKYGDGTIALRVVPAGRDVVITVVDHGPGFQSGYTPSAMRSLGMRLITSLARAPDPITIGRDGEMTSVSVHVVLPEPVHRRTA